MMGSKKQRSKAPPMNPPVKVTPAQQASIPSTQPGTVRCHCPPCKKGWVIAGPDSKSPFLRMPREVRDQIYGDLLVVKLSPDSQAQAAKINAAPPTALDEFERRSALEHFECDLWMAPGLDHYYRYRCVVEAKGLLLANKQIHAEASTIFFSKNEFSIMPEFERVHSFWRCGNPGCEPAGGPCYVAVHNFVNIKHLTIMVDNMRGLGDPMRKNESMNLYKNNQTIVHFFRLAGIKLKTLLIKYISCFDGQVEEMREDFEGPLASGMPIRDVTIKDIHGKIYNMSRSEAQQRLFQDHQVMEPFKAWKGAAEDVKVRGELPQAFIDELVGILTNEKVSVVTRKHQAKKRQAKVVARLKESQQQKFFRDMRDRPLAQGNTGMADLADQMTRTSLKSRMVMADLCAPPTLEELARMGAGPATTAASQTQNTAAVTDMSTNNASAGLGMIAGKVVFGPPRPPGMT